jgi:hypothetical protein
LELHGISIDDNDEVSDVEFLEDVMDWNERVANSPNAKEVVFLQSKTDGRYSYNCTFSHYYPP